MALAGPVIKFGIIADVQYADLADSNGFENRPQYYKSSLVKVRKAIEHFNTVAGELVFALNLGDVINGNSSRDRTLEDFERVAAEFDRLTVPAKHVVGNHCLGVPRELLLKRLGIPSTSYFAHDIAPGWRLIVLDTTEMSPHSGHAPDSQAALETAAFQAAHPLAEHCQLSEWNGGITAAQMRWLEGELKRAEDAGARCIVASHHPIGKGCGRDTHRAWNADEIEAKLNASPSVVAVFSGHDHPGGYLYTHGTHYVILQSVLECPEDSNAYAIASIFADRLVIKGFGTVPSRECTFKHAK